MYRGADDQESISLHLTDRVEPEYELSCHARHEDERELRMLTGIVGNAATVLRAAAGGRDGGVATAWIRAIKSEAETWAGTMA